MLGRIAALLTVLAIIQPVSARTLEEVRQLGRLTLCAYPSQLPFSSDRNDPPGVYVELGREIAAAMGVQLRMSWIGPRSRRKADECDIGFDERQGEEVKGYGISVTQPYLRTGVALLARRELGLRGYADLTPKHRIGVSLGSEAEAYLASRQLPARAFALVEEMEKAFRAGEVDVILVPAQITAYGLHAQPRDDVQLLHAYADEPRLAWNLVMVLRQADEAFLAEVNRTLSAIAQDGRLQALYARYGIPYLTPR